MLLWRVASSRGLVVLRRHALTQRRTFQTTPVNALYPRAPGLVPKVWFRPDGTPRSKLKGALLVVLAGTTFLTLWSFADLVEEYDHANFLLSFLVYAQQVDAKYDTQDLSTYNTTRPYFYALCCAIPDAPQPIIDAFFEAIDEVVQFSRQEITDEIHRLMVEFIHETHLRIQNMERDGATRTSNEVVHALYDTITSISRVHEEMQGEDGGRLEFSTIIKQNQAKEVPQRATDYESIG